MILLASKIEDHMLPCVNKTLFGIECMGCGLQRSVALILKGEFIAAFYMYPAIYPLIFLFAAIGLNIFKKVKYFNQIIITLSILAVATMIINFSLKTFIN